MDSLMSNKAAALGGASEVQSCFVFTVPGGLSGRSSAKLFRDPFGPQLLNRVARLLSTRGFEVTEGRPGRASDAGFKVRLDRLVIQVAVLVKRREEVTECVLLTWCCRPFLHRVWRRALEKRESDEWSRLSAAIDRILRENLPDLNLGSLLSLTRKQAEARWE
jgi:hypothetical protein